MPVGCASTAQTLAHGHGYMQQHAIEIVSQIWHSSLESVARCDSISANNFSKTQCRWLKLYSNV